MAGMTLCRFWQEPKIQQILIDAEIEADIEYMVMCLDYLAVPRTKP